MSLCNAVNFEAAVRSDGANDVKMTVEHAPTITVVEGTKGTLFGKRFWLDGDQERQEVNMIMTSGTARRVLLAGESPLADLMALKNGLANQALVGGTYDPELPDEIPLVLKGQETPGATVSRSNDYFAWHNGVPGFITIDTDGRGPKDVAPFADERAPIDREALKAQLRLAWPGVLKANYAIMESSSAGLVAGERLLKGLNRWHTHIIAKDAADIPRFLEVLHKRLWLVGRGWLLLNSAGVLLERSAVDLALRVPAQPIFGPPELGPGLTRRVPPPEIVEGEPLDTHALPDLTSSEEDRFQALVLEAKRQAGATYADEIARRQEAHVLEVSKTRNISIEDAKRLVQSRRRGLLLGSDILCFDRLNRPVTVGEVLREPERYDGRSLADPIEGPEYGHGKAKVYVNQANERGPIIHSLAHGVGTVYRLRHDAESLEATFKALGREELGKQWLWHMGWAQLNAVEHEEIVEVLGDLLGKGRRMVKRAWAEHEEELAKKREQKRREELARNAMREGRTVIEHEPARLNVTIEQVWPLLADVYLHMGTLVSVREGVSDLPRIEEEQEAPPQMLFKKYNGNSLRARIEDAAVFVDQRHQPIPVPGALPHELLNAMDPKVLPVAGILEHPVVTPSGRVICQHGYDPETRLYFACDPSLWEPEQKLERSDAQAALKWLREKYLAEFPFTTPLDADGAIALALTYMERQMMAEAPAGAISAAVRAAGKTALAELIHAGFTGRGVPATPLPEAEEEIEKRLLSILRQGLGYVIFDNVREGRAVESESLASCITGTGGFMGRVLGESEMAASGGRLFWVATGVNILTSGDFNSRVLVCRLEPNPERPGGRRYSRELLAWARENRTQICKAFVTLSAAYLQSGEQVKVEPSRFAAWDRLVREPILWAGGEDVRALLVRNEDDDPIEKAKRKLLKGLAEKYDGRFYAKDLVSHITPMLAAPVLGLMADDLISEAYSELKPKTRPTAHSIGHLLRSLHGRWIDEMRLQGETDRKETMQWWVERRPEAPGPG